MLRFSLLIAAIVVSFSYSFAQACEPLVCEPGLTYTLLLQSSGLCSTSVVASDLVSSDFSACPTPVSVAVYRRHEVTAAGDQFAPDFAERDTVLLTQEDEGTIIADVYLQDGNGVVQHCETYLLLNAGGQSLHCMQLEEPLLGLVATPNNEGISDVTIHVDGDLLSNTLTNADGTYILPAIPIESNIIITPERLDNPLNGVSTFDIVLVRKYILGLFTFDDPYRFIAADVNSSGTVTTLDAIHMRKLILGHYSVFPNAPSWRFIPTAYEFSVPTNPWAEVFPEAYVLNPVGEDFYIADFIGIKVGDVNGSVQVN